MRSREEIREALSGPVASVRTPFLRGGEIDFDGLRNTVDFNVAAGSRTMLLTAGDSHLLILSRREIADLTRATVEQTAGRAMVVAADGRCDTKTAVEFARFAREAGADVVMSLPSDWAESCTPETLCAHYAAVSEVMPLMVVTNIFAPYGAEFGLRTLELVLERVPNVVAIKDDFCGVFARRMTMLVSERWAVVSGGQKMNHLDIMPYGAHGYLSTFVTFKPEVAHRYWDAIQRKDLCAAAAVIRDYDDPFFRLIMGLAGGFDAAIHGVGELCGIAGRWRRPPHYSLNDAEMEALADALRRIGVL